VAVSYSLLESGGVKRMPWGDKVSRYLLSAEMSHEISSERDEKRPSVMEGKEREISRVNIAHSTHCIVEVV
jgi:hypothetical protein